MEITVTRNLNAPKFTKSSFRTQIDDNTAPGTNVATVKATDSDREVWFTKSNPISYDHYYLGNMIMVLLYVEYKSKVSVMLKQIVHILTI